MATLNVIKPLQQKLSYLEDSYFSPFKQSASRHRVHYLYRSTGESTSFYAVFYKNTFEIHDVSTAQELWTVSFEEGSDIACVDYFACSDDRFGVIVGVNNAKRDESSLPVCYLALVMLNEGQLQIFKKVTIANVITSLKTVLSCDQMLSKSETIHDRMKSWDNVIVVGTKSCHCYITCINLNDSEREGQRSESWDELVETSKTDALKSFVQGKYFEYSSADVKTVRYRADDVEVTAIGFLDKSLLLLIGLSMGGTITVALTSNPCLCPIQHPCSAPVRFFAPMEPDDDPRPHLWYFAVYDASVKNPAILALHEVFFPEEEHVPVDERKYLNPHVQIRLLHRVPNARKWISLRTIVREKDLSDTRDGDESVSRILPTSDRSQVFFSFITGMPGAQKNLMTGLFDLNAYYYKRLVQQVAADGTLAKQNAFLCYHFSPLREKHGEDYTGITDIAVDPTSITRFSTNSVEREQLFYPSALELLKMYVGGTNGCYIMQVASLQRQVLSSLSEDLSSAFDEPQSWAEYLHAVGLHTIHEITNPGHLSAGELSIVHTLVQNMLHQPLMAFIRECDDVQLRQQIAASLWSLIENTRVKLDDTTQHLFARFTTALSPAGNKELNLLDTIFQAVSDLFRQLIHVAKQKGDETYDVLNGLEIKRSAACNLSAYLQLIQRLILSKVLPMTETGREAIRKIQEDLKTRRTKQMEAGKTQLVIELMVQKLQRNAKDEPFWLNQPPSQWYPPALLNLLGTMLLLYVPMKSKRHFLLYFFFDFFWFYDGTSRTEMALLTRVSKLLDGIFETTRYDIELMFAQWKEECGIVFETEDVDTSANGSLLSTSQREDVDALLYAPKTLSREQEQRLKTLLRGEKDGMFRWQLYLIRVRRLGEVEEVDIPDDSDADDVAAYRSILALVRRSRQPLGESAPTVQTVWAESIKNAFKKFDDKSMAKAPIPAAPRRLSLLPHAPPKTPIALSRNTRKRSFAIAHLQETTTDNGTSQISQTETPPPAKMLHLNLDDSPAINCDTVSSETAEAVNAVLRTPGTRARAAAAADGRLVLDTTPETVAERMQPPQSILKSNKRLVEPSPSRGRLRFDLPDLESSSTLPENSAVGGSETLSQPNFDDDDDEGEEGGDVSADMSTISEHFEEVQSEEGSVDGDALEGHQEESVVFSEEQEEEGLEDDSEIQELTESMLDEVAKRQAEAEAEQRGTRSSPIEIGDSPVITDDVFASDHSPLIGATFVLERPQETPIEPEEATTSNDATPPPIGKTFVVEAAPTDSHADDSDIMERSAEVQDDVDDFVDANEKNAASIDDAGPQEDEEEHFADPVAAVVDESVAQADEQSTPKRQGLVDYSFNDSTMIATPTPTRNTKSVRTEVVIERSFEFQDDNDIPDGADASTEKPQLSAPISLIDLITSEATSSKSSPPRAHLSPRKSETVIVDEYRQNGVEVIEAKIVIETVECVTADVDVTDKTSEKDVQEAMEHVVATIERPPSRSRSRSKTVETPATPMRRSSRHREVSTSEYSESVAVTKSTSEATLSIMEDPQSSMAVVAVTRSTRRTRLASASEKHDESSISATPSVVLPLRTPSSRGRKRLSSEPAQSSEALSLRTPRSNSRSATKNADSGSATNVSSPPRAARGRGRSVSKLPAIEKIAEEESENVDRTVATTSRRSERKSPARQNLFKSASQPASSVAENEATMEEVQDVVDPLVTTSRRSSSRTRAKIVEAPSTPIRHSARQRAASTSEHLKQADSSKSTLEDPQSSMAVVAVTRSTRKTRLASASEKHDESSVVATPSVVLPLRTPSSRGRKRLSSEPAQSTSLRTPSARQAASDESGKELALPSPSRTGRGRGRQPAIEKIPEEESENVDKTVATTSRRSERKSPARQLYKSVSQPTGRAVREETSKPKDDQASGIALAEQKFDKMFDMPGPTTRRRGRAAPERASITDVPISTKDAKRPSAKK